MPETQRDGYMSQRPELLAGYHFVQAEHCERMKMAYANNPALFYKYAEQQYHHQALAHRYTGMSMGMMQPTEMMTTDGWPTME